MPNVAKALNIADIRELARRRLPRGLFEFIDRGCEDEVALRHNREALERIKLRARVLVGVKERSQEVTVFGKRQAMPLVISPTGPTGQVWYRGEVELARAAAKAGIPFTQSTPSATPLEDVIRDGGDGTKWFQLYMSHDRAASLALVERAREAGFETLVFTVDSIVSYNREFSARAGFALPFRLTPGNFADFLAHPRWLFGTIGRSIRATGNVPQFVNYPGGRDERDPRLSRMTKDDSLDWDVLRTLRKMWPRTLIVKGLNDPRDAVLAAECGADGVVISNHGGLLLDSAAATIDLLPEFVAAVGGRMAIFLDSGFRRGSDIVKAMGLGATAVFIGRATLYGVAAAGEAGATRALDILRDEIDRTLGIIGCRSIADVTREHVIMPGDPPMRVTRGEVRPEVRALA